jgi:uncharacterized protein YecE (DUF72 family)
MLPRRRRYAFEFRDASWYEDDILELLRKRDIALCLSDHEDAPSPWEVTASYVYIRGHGPTGQYHSRYSLQTLTKWAQSIRSWKRRGIDVFCYFDNDQKSAAPQDARRMAELLATSRKRKVKQA